MEKYEKEFELVKPMYTSRSCPCCDYVFC
ncbi:hypothetical protein [Acidianus sp. RZ1]